ncbi:alpha/beta hydrolase [Alteromonas lipolytica]|uniref:Alpha/beta hydrolase fold-3 domain-containing protein n=1 Tax=Alteromonas lipolytica TaxID=1856405 RepID=A0A1E8FB44_9ALTE|nr:alpha/beta hydrolase [Alteromonas lipolytica]OFI33129.1 hypothetical protein BFC17_02385 [Alteromonas lipolytica]GGF62236.1 esterase [Alteromonas lipolytica]
MDSKDPLVAPELLPSLNALMQLTEQSPPLNGANLGFYRKRAKFGGAKPLPDVFYEIADVAAGDGYRGFRLWLINHNTGDSAKPVILHFHGGGLVMGNCQNSLPRMQALAKSLNAVVVSVEYGLAPEVLAEEAQLQHLAALKWVISQAGQLGLDAAKIVLLGVSAGGCHATNLALRCAQTSDVELAGLALLYPMLDDRTGSTVIPPEHQGRYLWTAEQNRYGWQTFLGKAPGSAKIPAHHVPARAESVTGLPPTYIGVGELDLFFNENHAFAERLRQCGISVEINEVPGAFHAFESVAPDTAMAKQFNAVLMAAIGRFLPD